MQSLKAVIPANAAIYAPTLYKDKKDSCIRRKDMEVNNSFTVLASYVSDLEKQNN